MNSIAKFENGLIVSHPITDKQKHNLENGCEQTEELLFEEADVSDADTWSIVSICGADNWAVVSNGKPCAQSGWWLISEDCELNNPSDGTYLGEYVVWYKNNTFWCIPIKGKIYKGVKIVFEKPFDDIIKGMTESEREACLIHSFGIDFNGETIVTPRDLFIAGMFTKIVE